MQISIDNIQDLWNNEDNFKILGVQNREEVQSVKVYERLNKYIKDNGIKQSYISEKANIPENTLSMILNGKSRLDADKLQDIITALNIEPNIIIYPSSNSTIEISNTN